MIHSRSVRVGVPGSHCSIARNEIDARKYRSETRVSQRLPDLMRVAVNNMKEQHMRRSRVAVFSSLCFVLFSAGLVDAQGYPSRPIRIVTSAAGGGNDIQTRFFSSVIASSLGQPVVIDNRGGSLVSTEHVAKS